jgi:hypothetical protein
MFENNIEISHNVEYITAKYKGDILFNQTYDPMFLDHEYQYAFDKAKPIVINREIREIAKLPPKSMSVDRMLQSVNPDDILAVSLKAYACFHTQYLINIKDLVHYELPYDLILKNGDTYILENKK